MNRAVWFGNSKKTDKPWGHEVEWSGIFFGKQIFINAGCRTSLKFNTHKKEALFITSGENCNFTAMKLRTYSSNLNKGTVTILPPKNCFYNLKSIYQVLQQRKLTLHTLKTFGVRFLFTLLTSVAFLVLLNLRLSPNKQVIKTSPSQGSNDYVTIKN